MLPPAQILFAWFSAIGYISETKQIWRFNEEETERPWNPVLFAHLSLPERSTTSRVLFPGGAYTQSTVTVMLSSVLRHRHWNCPIWKQCLSRLCKRSGRGSPPWHWDIRAAYLFFSLNFVLWVYRNEKNRHREEVIQYSVRSLFSRSIFFSFFSVADWSRSNISMY